MKLYQVVLAVGAATLAVAQPHNHNHRHPIRHNGSPLDRRDDVATTTTTVAGPVVTVYYLNGVAVPEEQVMQGLSNGTFVLVGNVISSVLSATSTSSSSTSTTSVSSSSIQAANFLQVSSSTSTTSSSIEEPTTSSTPSPTPTPTPTTTAHEEQTTTSSTSSPSGTGVDSDFPSGTLPCSHFPSEYGAVAADWLGLGGWTGVQNTPGFSGLGLASAISYIETAIAGTSNACTAKSFCSYACPAGYQKSQWPAAQGSTGQSIGGLYCNADGKLELSRSGYTKLCQPGAGNVQVQNKLSKNVAICRTDYPGTESETVALNVEGGETQPVCNPDASTYFFWEGKATSAQYYINPSGHGVSDACKWGTAGSNLGNWAPVNMGVGKSTSGETFISIFQNAPTNTDGKLDFNIKITGGVSGDCKYENGIFYNNGVRSDSGCTASVSGTATFVFY